MPRTVDLWQYLPPYLKDFRELRALFSSEEPEFQGLSDELDRRFADFFILTAGEEGIARHEKIARIRPLPGDSLEDRRNRLLSVWYRFAPYNLATFIKCILLLQGGPEVSVSFDPDDPYHMIIAMQMTGHGLLISLRNLIREMVPANLTFAVRSEVEMPAKGIYAGTKVVCVSCTAHAAARRHYETESEGTIAMHTETKVVCVAEEVTTPMARGMAWIESTGVTSARAETKAVGTSIIASGIAQTDRR